MSCMIQGSIPGSSKRCPSCLWFPLSLLFSECGGVLSLGMKQPVWEVGCSPLVLGLRMSGVTPLLPLYVFFACTGPTSPLLFFSQVSAVMSSPGTMVKQRLDLRNAIYNIGQACCFTCGCIKICLDLWREKGWMQRQVVVWGREDIKYRIYLE